MNMFKLQSKISILLLTAFLMFSCNDDLLNEDVDPNFKQEELEITEDENFVSSDQALKIAEKFLHKEVGVETKALAGAKVESVIKQKNNTPAMYVVNYPEGGFVIVGATKSYFPILAYSDENSFDMETALTSGASVWLEETKEAIRTSPELDTEVTDQIRLQWLISETEEMSSRTIQSKSPQAMDERIEELIDLYALSGWQDFMSLDEASNWLDSYTYQTLVGQANYFESPTQSTIVAVRVSPSTVTRKGPWVKTKWHQLNYEDIYPCSALINNQSRARISVSC